MRSPDDTPLRDGNRDRLIGLLTERAAKTLMYYLHEINPMSYQWLFNFYKDHAIPKVGSWDEVSGEAFLRKLLSMPVEDTTYHTGRDSLFQNNVSGQVEPRKLAQRIMDIRSQLATEFIQDLTQVSEENSALLRETLTGSLSSMLDADVAAEKPPLPPLEDPAKEAGADKPGAAGGAKAGADAAAGRGGSGSKAAAAGGKQGGSSKAAGKEGADKQGADKPPPEVVAKLNSLLSAPAAADIDPVTPPAAGAAGSATPAAVREPGAPPADVAAPAPQDTQAGSGQQGEGDQQEQRPTQLEGVAAASPGVAEDAPDTGTAAGADEAPSSMLNGQPASQTPAAAAGGASSELVSEAAGQEDVAATLPPVKAGGRSSGKGSPRAKWTAPDAFADDSAPATPPASPSHAPGKDKWTDSSAFADDGVQPGAPAVPAVASSDGDAGTTVTPAEIGPHEQQPAVAAADAQPLQSEAPDSQQGGQPAVVESAAGLPPALSAVESPFSSADEAIEAPVAPAEAAANAPVSDAPAADGAAADAVAAGEAAVVEPAAEEEPAVEPAAAAADAAAELPAVPQVDAVGASAAGAAVEDGSGGKGVTAEVLASLKRSLAASEALLADPSMRRSSSHPELAELTQPPAAGGKLPAAAPADVAPQPGPAATAAQVPSAELKGNDKAGSGDGAAASAVAADGPMGGAVDSPQAAQQAASDAAPTLADTASGPVPASNIVPHDKGHKPVAGGQEGSKEGAAAAGEELRDE